MNSQPFEVDSNPVANPIAKQLSLLMNGSRVSRYHTVPTIHTETVGHHSSIVAGILLIVWPEIMTVDLLRHAIFHDSSEFVTGDIPSPAKRLMDRTALDALETKVMTSHHMEPHVLSDDMKTIFKFADNLAGIANCVFELKMGNLHVAEAYCNFTEYFKTSYNSGDHGSRVFRAYMAITEEVPTHLIAHLEKVSKSLKKASK